MYDELNLDEEESALGLGGDDTDSDDDGASDSEGAFPVFFASRELTPWKDLPHRTPLKDTRKTSHDDVTPSKKDEVLSRSCISSPAF